MHFKRLGNVLDCEAPGVVATRRRASSPRASVCAGLLVLSGDVRSLGHRLMVNTVVHYVHIGIDGMALLLAHESGQPHLAAKA